MNSRRIILTLATSLMLCFQALAGEPYSYIGTTDSKVMGKEETRDNMVLSVNETSEGLSVSMKDFELLGMKGISITGIVKVNEKGEVIGYEKAVIKGAPAKIKALSGTMTKDKADLRLTGKAGGAFNFDVRYTAKINK